jgi:hypothetical protein
VLRRTLALPGGVDLVYPVVLLLALVLPFEAIRPVLVTQWGSLSDEKVVLLAAVAAWLLLGRRALPSDWEWRALLPSVALLAVAVLSALLAPAFGDDALRFVWRLAAGGFALLLMVRLAREDSRDSRVVSLAQARTRLDGVLWALVLGAGASALLGLGEALGWSVLQPLLQAFKVAPTRVGGELRVSASFQYATIAAMYFEMVAPLAIVLAARARSQRVALLAMSVGVLCTANVVLSLTRAGMLTLAIVFGVLFVAGWRRAEWRRLLGPTAISAAVLIGGVVVLFVRNPVFDMRLVTESDAEWYGAAYSAPARLELGSGQQVRVGLDVRNEGRIAWSTAEQHPFALGYRWLTADGTSVLDVAPGEVPLPSDVAPGETLHLEPLIQVPNLPAGAYRIDWGMLQRDVVQFYERGWADAQTQVQVDQPAGSESKPLAMPATVPRDDDEAPWVVGRLDLWAAAVRLIEAHPLLGVGPDNFRHLYGAELGLDTWDERVQANNVYLEMLVDVGVVGLLAFVWLFVAPIRVLVARLRVDTGPNSYVLLGAGLGVLAFLVHGLLDSFLAFTPTGVLVWMLLGMILGLRPDRQKPQVSGR